MILYRKIGDDWIRRWERYRSTSDAITDPNLLPVWTINSFLLSNEEIDSGGGLSVYAAADKSELDLVTAALSLKSSFDTALFAGIELSAIENAGFGVEKTLGNTRISGVDEQHYEIQASSVGEAAKLAMLFLSGEFEKVQKQIAKNSRDKAAQAELIDFRQLANDNNKIGNGRLIRFIGEAHISGTGTNKP